MLVKDLFNFLLSGTCDPNKYAIFIQNISSINLYSKKSPHFLRVIRIKELP